MLTRALLFAAVAVIAVAADMDGRIIEGDIDARIIGGQEVDRNDARFIAQIFELVQGKHGKQQVKFVGTGAFVSQRSILTSASIIEKGKKYIIYYGSNNLVVSPHAGIPVVNILRPPKCDVERRVNNIALLVLEKAVTECKSCYDIEYLEIQTLPIEDDANLQTFGFGYINQPCYRGNKKSSFLRKTGMTVLSDHKCKRLTENASKKGRLICTRPNNYISTVCSGDEGAALVDMTYKRIVGIMNFGDEYCESGAPVVYTSIAPYAMWLDKNIVY